MVSLEEAKKIVLAKHPNEWVYQVTEYKDKYQFWLLPNNEKWYPTTFVVDTPIVDKKTGRLNNNGTALDTLSDRDYKLHVFKHTH